jgi:RNA polymerase sigma-70 factor (ECF subfamily)
LEDVPPERLSQNPGLGEPPEKAFLALLDQLSPASRAVLLLHYQHDLSLEESAAVLEIPLGTVKSRLHYGVSALRKQLTSERNPA